MTDDLKKPESKQISNRAGLAWAESGNPFFYCVIGEKRSDKIKSFDDTEPILEIVHEGEYKVFAELTEAFEILKGLRCSTIYTILEPRYLTFIRNFNHWRRVEKSNLAFKQTKSSSFESSLLKIKELIGEKRLLFPEESIIKAQLTIFSKSNLKDAVDFYAVRALTMVIDAFGKQVARETDEIPNMKGWW